MSRHSLYKPLPEEPDHLQPAVEATLPKQHRHHTSTEQCTHRSSRISQTPLQQSANDGGRTSFISQPRTSRIPPDEESSVLADLVERFGPPDVSSSSPDELDNLEYPDVSAINDSVNFTGSNPATERRIQKRWNTPARFGLFPDSKPATPESLSRVTSHGTARPVSVATTAPKNPPPLVPRHSHFSLRRIFHRKSRVKV